MDILTKSPRIRRRILCFLYKIEGLFLKIKQSTPNMNIIIAKLGLPCDLKNEIYKYCYNSEGYSGNDLVAIEKEKNKKRTKFMKLRHKLELVEWYRMGTSVSWLRGGGTYGKKSPNKVYGGGTLAESQYLRYYNGITSTCPTINDPRNNYIEKNIAKGDNERRL